MSFISKTEEAPQVNWKKLIIPGYILVSALFIVYVLYVSVVGGVYNVALSSGVQEGYARAISELIQQTSKEDCKPVAITLQDTKVEVINVACLQTEPAASTPAPQAQQVEAQKE